MLKLNIEIKTLKIIINMTIGFFRYVTCPLFLLSYQSQSFSYAQCKAHNTSTSLNSPETWIKKCSIHTTCNVNVFHDILLYLPLNEKDYLDKYNVSSFELTMFTNLGCLDLVCHSNFIT